MVRRAERTRLIGRSTERATLSAFVDGLSGGGGTVVVRGEAGIGKTALLTEIVAVAGDAVRPVWVSGIESEIVLPFAVLGEVLRPLRRFVERLPVGQRRALQVALGAEPDGGPNPLAVGNALLGLLALAGDDRPLLLVVDDFQWVDPSSQRLLTFAGRRLDAERAGLVLAVREHADRTGPPGLATIDLTGLSAADCATMLDQRSMTVPSHVLALVHEQTGGNPLAMLETVGALDRGAFPLDAVELPGPGPVLSAVWSDALDQLSEPTRNALFVVAAARNPDIGTVERVLAALGMSVADLLDAERLDLVRAGAESLRLRHPLLRPVVVARTPLAFRLAAYRAFAHGAPGHERAWYLAAARPGPDDEIADLLELAARSARRRNGLSVSAHTWHRCARMTIDRTRRAQRLLEAAADAQLAGSCELALTWCEEALGACDDLGFTVRVELVRGRAHAWHGDVERAYRDLVHAAAGVALSDPELAARLYTEAMHSASMSGRPLDGLYAAERAVALAVAPCSASTAPALAMVGRVAEANEQLRALAELPAGPADAADPLLVVEIAQTHQRLEQLDPARRLLDSVILGARRTGAVSTLVIALVARADVEWWAGAWAAARADATEALRWARESEQASTVGYGLCLLARIDAHRGAAVAARRTLDEAHAAVAAYRIGSLDFHLGHAAGVLALLDDDHEAAVELLEPLWRRAGEVGLRSASVVPFVPDLAESHLRCGNLDRAAELTAWLAELAAESGLAYPAIAQARLLGLLSPDPDEAAAAFARALAAHAGTPMPFEHGRTLLCAAESLRRTRRPSAARPPLREAHTIFRGLGAAAWTARTEREFARVGARSPDPDGRGRPAPGALTPQEYQVARLVTDGLNNAEVATALYLSGKTIEGHLTRIYRKLRVRSRTELARRFTASG